MDNESSAILVSATLCGSGSLGHEPMPAIDNNYHKDGVGCNSCTSVSLHGGHDIPCKCVRKATDYAGQKEDTGSEKQAPGKTFFLQTKASSGMTNTALRKCLWYGEEVTSHVYILRLFICSPVP